MEMKLYDVELNGLLCPSLFCSFPLSLLFNVVLMNINCEYKKELILLWINIDGQRALGGGGEGAK